MRNLLDLRHELHQLAEVSHQERRTSERVREVLEDAAPDRILTGLGGHGLAAVYDGSSPGPRVLFRCELDALPIPETVSLAYSSTTDGASHKCGHDGHMTIVCGLAQRLADERPRTGTAILLFQPAEETGEGAARVLSDPAFESLRPDAVFALHNLPGFPLGRIIVRDGPFAAASIGFKAQLTGATSHAAEPEAGNSPTLALSHLLAEFSAMPQRHTALHENAKVTVIHAKLGEQAFGTSPGSASIMATLRSYSDDTIKRLTESCSDLTRRTADAHFLTCEIETTEFFPSTVNDPAAVERVCAAAGRAGLSVHELQRPFAWSEDFGHFTAKFPGALIGIGAGENHPPLHHPTYDFPDALLEPGMEMLWSIIESYASSHE